MERSRNGRRVTTNGSATAAANGREAGGRARQRALCVASLAEGDDLAELAELLRTAGVAVVGELVQHREHPHPNTYLGPGKVREAKSAAAGHDANLTVCDAELTARQERSEERRVGKEGRAEVGPQHVRKS